MTTSLQRLHDELSERLPAGVFNIGAAQRSGVTKEQLYSLVTRGRVTRVAHGLYTVRGASGDDHLDWIIARAQRLNADAVIAHESAAALWGLRTPHLNVRDHRELWILRSPATCGARQQADLRVLPARFEERHVTLLNGLRVTTLERTALDLARGNSFERALAVLDHALALGADRNALMRTAVYMNGWPSTRVLRPAIHWADPLSESGLESMARGRALASRLPLPELQVAVTGASGAPYRADLAWVRRRTILEIDGREKYDAGRAALLAEKRREDDLRAADWTVVRMGYEDIYDPERTRWLQLAFAIGSELLPYDRNFGMTERSDPLRHRRSARS